MSFEPGLVSLLRVGFGLCAHPGCSSRQPGRPVPRQRLAPDRAARGDVDGVPAHDVPPRPTVDRLVDGRDAERGHAVDRRHPHRLARVRDPDRSLADSLGVARRARRHGASSGAPEASTLPAPTRPGVRAGARAAVSFLRASPPTSPGRCSASTARIPVISPGPRGFAAIVCVTPYGLVDACPIHPSLGDRSPPALAVGLGGTGIAYTIAGHPQRAGRGGAVLDRDLHHPDRVDRARRRVARRDGQRLVGGLARRSWCWPAPFSATRVD